MKRRLYSGMAVAAAAFCLSPAARAQEAPGVDFSGSGFLTLAAGKVVRGDAPSSFNGYRAPAFVTDYAQAGVYENNELSIKPDSRLGLQGTTTFDPQFSLTGQVVSRGAQNGKANLEWAYGSYYIDDQLTFQLGRKRLPLFYYSETQDVGFSYPWVHLPSGQYGWEIVNYNGANLRYQAQWENWASSLNVFAGSETRTDNGYWKIYNGKGTRTNSKWSNIAGADMLLSRDWFEARAAYVQSDIQNTATLPPYDYTPKARQKIYSLSFSVDQPRWVVRNEYLYMDRKPIGEEDFSFLLGVGYRVGKFLPMVTYNRYKMRLASPHADPLAAEGWSILAFSLRYDLTSTSAVKMQLDRWRDRNGPNFNTGTPYGNPTLLSVSYDKVF